MECNVVEVRMGYIAHLVGKVDGQLLPLCPSSLGGAIFAIEAKHEQLVWLLNLTC